jgi:hypothetical protein
MERLLWFSLLLQTAFIALLLELNLLLWTSLLSQTAWGRHKGRSQVHSLETVQFRHKGWSRVHYLETGQFLCYPTGVRLFSDSAKNLTFKISLLPVSEKIWFQDEDQQVFPMFHLAKGDKIRCWVTASIRLTLLGSRSDAGKRHLYVWLFSGQDQMLGNVIYVYRSASKWMLSWTPVQQCFHSQMQGQALKAQSLISSARSTGIGQLCHHQLCCECLLSR